MRAFGYCSAVASALAFGFSLASCYFITNFEALQGGSGPGTTSSTGTGGAAGATNLGGGGAGAAGAGGTGTGGGGQACPPPGVDYSGLVLNELAPKGLPEDWMELHNGSANPIPLCAVFITQGYDGLNPPGGGDRFTFGLLTIGAGQYLVIQQMVDFPYGLAKDQPERITLFAPDSTVLDDTAWNVSAANEFQATESWARIPDSVGPFVRISSPTKGDENVDVAGGGGGAGGAQSGGGGTGG